LFQGSRRQTSQKKTFNIPNSLPLLKSVAHLPLVRKNKAHNLSLSPDLWEWIHEKADIDGMRIPVSRVIAHLLSQVIEKEKSQASTSMNRRPGK
jgi:hypothetical protein